MAGGAGSSVGTGGMYSKILAAKRTVNNGITVNIISGKKSGLIVSLLKGNHHGTEFRPVRERLSSRKGWIVYGSRAKGSLHIDEGAVKALLHGGKSLLPSGITAVTGVFEIGDAVYCVDSDKKKDCKGNYELFINRDRKNKRQKDNGCGKGAGIQIFRRGNSQG